MTMTLEQLEKLGPKTLLALLLWKDRHRNPALSVTVDQRDLDGLEQCLTYQKLEAEVKIWRKPTGVIVALVEKGSELKDKDGNLTSIGNAITPIENNEADLARAEREKVAIQTRADAPRLARLLRSEDAAGICSRDTVMQCAAALELLAHA